MGFYAPAQIVRDAREHSVEVRAPDVNFSAWDSALEIDFPPPCGEGLRVGVAPTSPHSSNNTQLQLHQTPTPNPSPQGGGEFALRLGLREVDGLKETDAQLITSNSTITSLHRAGLPVSALEKLSSADAFRSVGLDRRAALWEVKALAKAKPLPLFAFAETRDQGDEEKIQLPEMPLSEHVVNDYQTLKLSLKAHPMSFLREHCNEQRITDNVKLKTIKNNALVSVAGVVLVRQRPGSAKGVVFLTLEDEFSVCNVVIWPHVLETHRSIVMGARLMLIRGRVQKSNDVLHVVANRVEDKTGWLKLLIEDQDVPKNPPSARHPRQVRVIPKSRDFH
jgi:error-prone DNA polymerase